ncbi:MAG TPA: PKD domain-containing protein [Phnomibacter sp.]|nr:PKD domain-containing protein [Phnomibacter sp.]
MTLRVFLLTVLVGVGMMAGYGQNCPPNIDFENGNLDGWKFFVGNVSDQNGVNVFSLTESSYPVEYRHEIIPASQSGVDPYGGFPTRSPNGSDYCLKLGNNMGGGEAEAISYEFTIPANRNTYSLLYYYAVVFQGPNHQKQQQPRMEIDILNVTRNTKVDCASFSFIPFGTALPGFFESDVRDNDTPTWCKDWTPVTINLDGNAGSTIRLTFRTGDCTFRRHFGYAYIDVASDCSGELTGASFCPMDKEVSVSAPFGFQDYAWYNQDMTKQLGSGQTLKLSPPPASGTILNVKLVPYSGYGCEQTMTTRLIDNLDVEADAGVDMVSCNFAPVRIGAPVRRGVEYQWSPAEKLSNPMAANPLASPDVNTQFVLTTRSPGGGCIDTDTVNVVVSQLSSDMLVLGKTQFCIGSGDSAVMQVSNAQTIHWYKNGEEIVGANTNRYKALVTGNYMAVMRDHLGCVVSTVEQPINISTIPVARFSMANAAQCLVGNRFVFTNQSTNAVGAMEYEWSFGGNGASTLKDPVYNFTAAGRYPIRLLVRSNGECVDSITAMATVHQNPVPMFDIDTTCIGLPFVPVNNTADTLGSTIHYSWRYGNQFFSDKRTPPSKAFATPGTYTVSLAVYSDQCPTPVQSLNKNLLVESPTPARRYPAVYALRNLAMIIEARNVGVTASWSPATFLSDTKVYKPVFKGNAKQDYRITLTSQGGCVTVDSLLVEVVDKADIAVPNAFTPNSDGLNDVLRPIPIGVSMLKYFRVYNRWGQLMFETSTFKQGWDGNIKGLLQPAQNVVWMVEGIGLDGSVITKKGTSMLIR